MSQQDAYVAELEAQVLQWTAGLERLKAKAEKLGAGLRDTYAKQIEESKGKLAVARLKLDALKGVGSDKWEAAEATVESFWKDVKAVLERAGSSSLN